MEYIWIPIIVESNKAGLYSFDVELETKYSDTKPRKTIDVKILYADASGEISQTPSISTPFLIILLLFSGYLAMGLKSKLNK